MLPVLPEDPTTWLNNPPATLAHTVEAMQDEGETIVGWKWLTEQFGSGTMYRTGYLVVTMTGLTYFNLDGIGTRSSALHAV